MVCDDQRQTTSSLVKTHERFLRATYIKRGMILVLLEVAMRRQSLDNTYHESHPKKKRKWKSQVY